MTSISEGQPTEKRAFSNQDKGHLGSRYILVFIMQVGLHKDSHLMGDFRSQRVTKVVEFIE